MAFITNDGDRGGIYVQPEDHDISDWSVVNYPAQPSDAAIVAAETAYYLKVGLLGYDFVELLAYCELRSDADGNAINTAEECLTIYENYDGWSQGAAFYFEKFCLNGTDNRIDFYFGACWDYECFSGIMYSYVNFSNQYYYYAEQIRWTQDDYANATSPDLTAISAASEDYTYEGRYDNNTFFAYYEESNQMWDDIEANGSVVFARMLTLDNGDWYEVGDDATIWTFVTNADSGENLSTDITLGGAASLAATAAMVAVSSTMF